MNRCNLSMSIEATDMKGGMVKGTTGWGEMVVVGIGADFRLNNFATVLKSLIYSKKVLKSPGFEDSQFILELYVCKNLLILAKGNGVLRTSLSVICLYNDDCKGN